MWTLNCLDGRRVALFVLILVMLSSYVEGSTRRRSARRTEGPTPVYECTATFVAHREVTVRLSVYERYTPRGLFTSAIPLARAHDPSLPNDPNAWTYEIYYRGDADPYTGAATDLTRYQIGRTRKIFFILDGI